MKITCEHCNQEMDVQIGALMRARAMETTTVDQRKISARNAGIASGKARKIKAKNKLSTRRKKKAIAMNVR